MRWHWRVGEGNSEMSSQPTERGHTPKPQACAKQQSPRQALPQHRPREQHRLHPQVALCARLQAGLKATEPIRNGLEVIRGRSGPGCRQPSTGPA